MSEYDRIDNPRVGVSPIIRWSIVLAVAFVAGSLSMGWLLTRWDAAAPYLSWLRSDAPATLAAPAAPPPIAVAPLPDTTSMVHRVAELESHIDEISERANAASGNADRAEGLLVAFAARRAVDRGLQLGYIEGLLRDRFGKSQPGAVATIVSAAQKPVTLDELRTQLDVIAPELTGLGPQASWWDSAKRELASMIVIRRAELPSVRPDDRIERARRNLEAGLVDRALAEVARLPARDKAQSWMDNARRYIAAHNALDLIETAALLSPAHILPATPSQAEPSVKPTNEAPSPRP